MGVVNALQSKGDFVSNVAHELRIPLSVPLEEAADRQMTGPIPSARLAVQRNAARSLALISDL